MNIPFSDVSTRELKHVHRTIRWGVESACKTCVSDEMILKVLTSTHRIPIKAIGTTVAFQSGIIIFAATDT